MIEIIVGMLAAYPEFTVFMTFMGFMRSVNKPLFSLIQKIVDSTDTTLDNEKWRAIRDHKVMGSALWLLDFTTSVKIPKK